MIFSNELRNQIALKIFDTMLKLSDEMGDERTNLVKSKAFSQVFLITHTTIPPEIQTHRIFVTKNQSTRIGSARFERQTPVIEDL